MVILAVDPGSKKCGLAVVSASSGVLSHAVVLKEELADVCRSWVAKFAVNRVIVGGSTGSRPTVALLQKELALPVTVVDEKHTTERARLRYFQDNPPRGLWRLVPLTMRVPPGWYDDYAAVVMAEDYLQANS